jgi:hypothetical protein
MLTHRSWFHSILTLSVATVAACGGDADRFSADTTEQDRALELALSGDTSPATFEDTALTPVPEATPPDPEPEPGPPPARRIPPRAERTEPERQDPSPRASQPPAVEPEPEPDPVFRTVPVGTTMHLSLDVTLSTRDNEIGDAFTATVSAHVMDADGTVLIPAGATVRGRVTEVRKSGRVGETALLSLAFEAVSFEGESYPFEAAVVSANPERVSRESTGEQVGKAAAGAAAGAILGRVLGGNTKSTVKGAVIGAAAGTAIALGTADVDAVLKAGSPMVVRTEAPVVVAGPAGT